MSMYMIFRVDDEVQYDCRYHTVSFRGVREGLSDLFTDPSKSDELDVRKDGTVHAYIKKSEDRDVEYIAVPMPQEVGTGPDHAIELFTEGHCMY